jgi:hypothetical protein
VALALVAALAAAAGADARKPKPKPVPSTFVGMVADGPLFDDPSIDFDAQLNAMVTAGVQTLRVVFNWAGAQPYQSMDQVPEDQRSQFRDEGGVPTNYSPTDRIVTSVAQRHIAVLPIVLVAPAWDARHPARLGSPPDRFQPYADFAGLLVRRYGPGGSFWSEHPELDPQPIRNWQIWNEPSLKSFWIDQPFASDYVKLLRLARQSIKAADPGAKIVLAGLPNKSWTALAQVYKAGGRGLFDIAAFHPFTATVDGVKTILGRDRAVMSRNGDKRIPIWVTELSWTSAKGQTTVTFGNEETAAGQAKKLVAAYTMLAGMRDKGLRVRRVYWYTWVTHDERDDYPFDWAGLMHDTRADGVQPKPAYSSFKHIALKLERCRRKSGRADRCAS